MKQAFIFPEAQKISRKNGFYQCKEFCGISFDDEYRSLFAAACSVCGGKFFEADSFSCSDAKLIKTEGLSKEAYRISIQNDGIYLFFSEKSAAFYALITLWQLYKSFKGRLPCMEIEDAPKLQIRGLMLDVSRGKIPTLDTLKLIVNRMARCKLNHLQLYIEGLSFAYPRHKKLWMKETPITPEEIRLLDLYCKERFIELVPCQNALGHMSYWLAQPEYNPLAECEKGFSVMGMQVPPTTLDVCDEKSLAFVTELFDDLLPNYTSCLCNVCLDEPFEMCMGKNSKLSKQKYSLYADYAVNLNNYFRTRQKRMMMWGDVLAKDSNALNKIPDDVIIIDWGYEAEHPVEERAAALEKSGHNFCLCPGTNSWLSFTGLSDNMLACIQKAAQAALRYKAMGIIVSDWGDMGHLQYLPVSWAGILNGAAAAWSCKPADEEMLAAALNRFIFEDDKNIMGQLSIDAGRYSQYEEFRLPCRTLASTMLTNILPSKEKYEQQLKMLALSTAYFSPPCVYQAYFESYNKREAFDCEKLSAFIESLLLRLSNADMHCEDKELVRREYKNALLLVNFLSKLRQAIYDEKPLLKAQTQLSDILEEHRILWKYRNKPQGCENGLLPLVQIQEKLNTIV